MTQQFNKMHWESKQFKKLMVFPMVIISPQFAADLLSINTDNRPLKNATLNKYVEDMNSGNWKFTGDTIQISKTGKLLNGQHRLMAIVKTGKAQMFNIQSGLEDSSFEVMDIGKNRSGSDALAIKGFENHSTIASMIRFILLYREGRLKSSAMGGAGGDNKKSISEISEFADKQDKEFLQQCATMSHRLFKKFRMISSPTYAGLLWIFGQKNRQEAFDFFELLVTGENIGQNNFSMIFLLRNRLINMSTGSSTMRTVDKYALIIKAWNFYRAGKEIKSLSWNGANEDFPIAK